MATKLSALAALVGGRILGETDVELEGAAALLDAGAGDITLVDKLEKASRLAASGARAVVVPMDFPDSALTMPAIAVPDVHHAFAEIVMHFRPPRRHSRIGVSPAAHVSPKARLIGKVDIHAGATVGDDVEIGDGTTIHCGRGLWPAASWAKR